MLAALLLSTWSELPAAQRGNSVPRAKRGGGEVFVTAVMHVVTDGDAESMLQVHFKMASCNPIWRLFVLFFWEGGEEVVLLLWQLV